MIIEIGIERDGEGDTILLVPPAYYTSRHGLCLGSYLAHAERWAVDSPHSELTGGPLITSGAGKGLGSYENSLRETTMLKRLTQRAINMLRAESAE